MGRPSRNLRRSAASSEAVASALACVLVQAVQADSFEVGRDAEIDCQQLARLATQDLLDRLHCRLALERRRPVVSS